LGSVFISRRIADDPRQSLRCRHDCAILGRDAFFSRSLPMLQEHQQYRPSPKGGADRGSAGTRCRGRTAPQAREAVEKQIADLDRKVMQLARNEVQVRRFMTAPGIGPITALCYLAIIDDPTRFKRSRSVGAYVGLTSRRYASGEVDWTGRISKCGDAMLRSYLYEAAGVLLTRVAKWSVLKAWGMRVAKRSGLRKAKVAVARKRAVILHRMWIDGTEFKWSAKEVATQPA
jgi:transposase